MRRILQVGPRGLILIGVVVAVAVLVLPGGARPAAAVPTSPHYKCYDVPPAPTPGPDPDVTVKLETQFGTEEAVEVGPGRHLCAPAIKTLLPDGYPEGNLGRTHLRCHDIVGGSPPDPPATVTLATQFGVEKNVVVGPATELCVPTLKTVVGEPPPEGPLPDHPHYKCYEIDGLDPPELVDLETQFGITEDVVVGPAIQLCVPAIKTVLTPPGEPEGNLYAPDLVCHTMVDGTPPTLTPTAVPGSVSVSLETQFYPTGTPEPDQAVGLAEMLCVPALKGPIVGGIADLPALAEGSAQSATPADGSGWSTGAYAALAGIAAVALMALGGGAWYARRRWTR